MLRAMDSAVAGLRAHQNKMDVIGHNLANVNTFGFKAQTYTFKEAMYQTSTASTGGTTDAGGSNAAQYGYGTLMGTIGTDMTSSTPTYVGGLNASINGEGFFLTASVKFEDSNSKVGTGDGQYDTTVNNFKECGADWDYTRVGQFLVDSNGYLVDGNGNFVYGFRPDDFTDGKVNDGAYLQPIRIPTAYKPPTDTDAATYTFDEVGTTSAGGAGGAGGTDPVRPMKATSVSINKLGQISATLTAETETTTGTGTDTETTTYAGVNLGTLAIVTFQNPDGLTKAGGTYYKATGDDNTGRADATVPGGDTPELMSGYIEASNVDLAKEFADMITTHRGFQANSKMITVSDEILSDLVNMKR